MALLYVILSAFDIQQKPIVAEFHIGDRTVACFIFLELVFQSACSLHHQKCLFHLEMLLASYSNDWSSCQRLRICKYQAKLHFVIMGFLRFCVCSFIASLLQNITSCMPAIEAHFFYCRKCPLASL